MTDLVVRKVPWEFDASVPFMWKPKNPSFGLFCGSGCPKPRTTIPPTDPYRIGPIPGCVSTSVIPI